MASKKKQNEQEVLELPVLVQDGDYFSAEVKMPGKQKNIKIRGMVESTGVDYNGFMEFELVNNQHGYDLDCDHEFSFAITISQGREEDMENSNIINYTKITDKRLIKVIENDKLPEIAGFRAKRGSDGQVTFGCGAVEVSKAEIKIFLEGMERLSGMKGKYDFFQVCDNIMGEESVDTLLNIDLKEVAKLLERLN